MSIRSKLPTIFLQTLLHKRRPQGWKAAAVRKQNTELTAAPSRDMDGEKRKEGGFPVGHFFCTAKICPKLTRIVCHFF